MRPGTSTARISYCEAWSRGYKEVSKPWTPERARKAHDAGKLYTVLVGDPKRPDCCIDIVRDDLGRIAVGVIFLDEHLREHLEYSFQEQPSGKLFLTMCVERRYEGDTDKVVFGTSFHLNPDGRVIIIDEDFLKREIVERKVLADVSCCWEPIPQFGDYESIARRERPSAWQRTGNPGGPTLPPQRPSA